MSQRISQANLQVSKCLADFIEFEVLPNTGINATDFWLSFAHIIKTLAPENSQLLKTRDQLQEKINQWHKHHQGAAFNFEQYKQLLKDINYLVPPVEDFTITTKNVDDELSLLAGPQLVVPIMNARFALNAVNARWGSLYDALYGSDVISDDNGAKQVGSYNPARGEKVTSFMQLIFRAPYHAYSICLYR